MSRATRFDPSVPYHLVTTTNTFNKPSMSASDLRAPLRTTAAPAFLSLEAITNAADLASTAVGPTYTPAIHDLVETLTATQSQDARVLLSVPLAGNQVRHDGAHSLVVLWGFSARFDLSADHEHTTMLIQAEVDQATSLALGLFFLRADTTFLRSGGRRSIELVNGLVRAVTGAFKARVAAIGSDPAGASAENQHVYAQLVERSQSLLQFASRFSARPDELTSPLVAALDAMINLAYLSRDFAPPTNLLDGFDAACASGVPHIGANAHLAASDVAQWFSLQADARILQGQHQAALESVTILLSLPAAHAHPLQARAARTRILLLLLTTGKGAPLPQLMAPHVRTDLQAKPSALMTQARCNDNEGMATLGPRRARGESQSAALLAAAEEAKKMAVYTTFERAYQGGDSTRVHRLVTGDQARIFAQDNVRDLARTCAAAHPARRIQRAANLYQSVPLKELATFLQIGQVEDWAQRVGVAVQDAVGRNWIQARIEGEYIYLSPTPSLGIGAAGPAVTGALRQALTTSQRDMATVLERSRTVEASPAFLVAVSGSLVAPQKNTSNFGTPDSPMKESESSRVPTPVP